MLGNDACPLQLGYYQDGTRDPKLLGSVYELRNQPSQLSSNGYAQPDNDARSRIVRLVLNDSGGALLPGQAVKYEAGFYGLKIGAVCGAGDVPDGIVDDTLPAAGVPNGSQFFIVVSGPTRMQTDGTSNILNGSFVTTAATGYVSLQTTTASMTAINSTAGRAEAPVNNAATAGTLFSATVQLLGRL